MDFWSEEGQAAELERERYEDPYADRYDGLRMDAELDARGEAAANEAAEAEWVREHPVEVAAYRFQEALMGVRAVEFAAFVVEDELPF